MAVHIVSQTDDFRWMVVFNSRGWSLFWLNFHTWKNVGFNAPLALESHCVVLYNYTDIS